MRVNLGPYLGWSIEAIAPRVRSWISEDRLHAASRENIEATIFRDSETALREYAEACPCEGAAPSEYGLREIELSPDLSVLAGIRFRGPDVDFPFVGVFAQSRFLSLEEIDAVVHRLSYEFERFRPRWVRLWSASGREDLRRCEGARGDLRVVADWIPDVMGRPRPAGWERVELELDPDARCFEEYVATYDEFFESFPKWRGRLQVEDRESLLECAREGALHCVRVDGEFTGVVAARSGQLRELEGWEMVDELLTEPFRGKKLAPAMQRLFLEQLDLGTNKIVFGTIEEENLASLRTALRVGRVDVGGWVFLPLGGRELVG
jgi:RimJ/RimL family protein N-acetyltransferase